MDQKPTLTNHEERLIELETQIAFQEDALHSLSDTVAAQQRQIDDLTTMVKIINRQLKSLADTAPGQPGEEPPPPHY